MNNNMFIGVMLVALGVVVLAYQGIHFKSREKAVDLGPIQVSHTVTRTLPPLVGGLALAGGIVLLVLENRRA
jgi:uncharacterized membrane protein